MPQICQTQRRHLIEDYILSYPRMIKIEHCMESLLKSTDRLFGYGSVLHHESRALDSLPSSSSSLSLRLVLSLTELNASVVFLVGSYITRTDYLKMIRVYVYTPMSEYAHNKRLVAYGSIYAYILKSRLIVSEPMKSNIQPHSRSFLTDSEVPRKF